jgi:hypothetical protein
MVTNLNLIFILLNISIISILYKKRIYNKEIETTDKFIFHLINLPSKFLKYKIFDDIDSHLFNRVNLLTRKGEGIGYRQIKANNMNCFIELYEDINFLNFISDIVGEKIFVCPEFDKHRIGIYKYCKKGDFIDWHYDKSFYNGRRYTVLIALKNCNIEQECNLEYKYKDKIYKWNSQKFNMIIFNGNQLYHRVSKMKEHNFQTTDRIIFTMEYITDTRINFINKFIDDIKNRIVYKF